MSSVGEYQLKYWKNSAFDQTTGLYRIKCESKIKDEIFAPIKYLFELFR